MTDALSRFAEKASSRTILVAGDVMLDAYVSGDASRISPEAPVPIVNVSTRRYVPGGAGNVAANVRSLGARVILAGVTGIDDAAVRLRIELERMGVETSPLAEDAGRPTTVKTRITAAGQQIVRFDEEDRSPVSEQMAAVLRQSCREVLPSVDALVISDYAKGVVSEPLCGWLIETAAALGKPIIVDPKSRELSRYRGATLITPNVKEAALAAAMMIETENELVQAARSLLRIIAPSALLITRGEQGMSLFEIDGQCCHFPALVNEVADVTGAGDTVAAALAIALSAGFSLADGALVANAAGAAAVSHPGTWAVRPEELARMIPGVLNAVPRA